MEVEINERGQEMTYSIIFIWYKSSRRWNIFFCHVFYLYIHTDRPRCYALMREDYLWSPLQSACSMQHLRSVSSLGRQCGPPPALTCPATTIHHLFLPNPPSTFPLCPLFHLLPCRYPEWCVSTLLLPASSSPDFITCKFPMEITPPRPVA